MNSLVPLTSLPEALVELELAAAIVLLAEQEMEPLHDAMARLRRALLTLNEARDLAAELATATGRPYLRVVAGSPVLAPAPESHRRSDGPVIA